MSKKLYLQWNLINSAASYLSDDFVAQDFDFYGKDNVRQKRDATSLETCCKYGRRCSLGEVVGQMYVEKYFPAAAKERMVTLVKNLQTSLGERINALNG